MTRKPNTNPLDRFIRDLREAIDLADLILKDGTRSYAWSHGDMLIAGLTAGDKKRAASWGGVDLAWLPVALVRAAQFAWILHQHAKPSATLAAVESFNELKALAEGFFLPELIEARGPHTSP